MITVSSTFKDAIKTNGKLIGSIITDSTTTYTKKDIVSIDYSYKADLFKSFMRECDIELQGLLNLKGKQLNVQFGVKQNHSDNYEYISFGNFIVKEQEEILNTKSTKLECYDLMLKSMIPYELDVTYPITVSNYLKAICDTLGWVLADSIFINSDKEIIEEKYNNTYKFRDVLDEIASMSLSLIGFKNDNKLHVIYPIETNEIINFNLRKFIVNNKYGPINSLVIARTPQEDNIFRKDEESVISNGLTEVKIENNQIMDKNRDVFIDNMFNYVKGLEYYPFQFESFGVCYLEPGDRFTAINPLTGIPYNTILLQDNIQITQGLNEVAVASIPSLTKTDYDKASKTDRAINETKLQVDKQNQKITGLIINIEGQNEKLAEMNIEVGSIKTSVSETNEKLENEYNTKEELSNIITQTVNETENLISETGGFNLLLNSPFYQNADSWVKSDDLLFDVLTDNTEIEQNTSNKTELVLKTGSLNQTVTTIIGKQYTISFKYKKPINDDRQSYIRLYRNDIDYLEVFNSNAQRETREQFSFTYIASVNNPKLVIFTDNSEFRISDLIIQSGTSTEWTANAFESRGISHKLTKGNLTLYNLSSKEKAEYDSNDIKFYDGSNNLKAEYGVDFMSVDKANINNESNICGLNIKKVSKYTFIG